MANLNSNITIQNIREYLESQITTQTALYYNYAGQETRLYNVKLIWGGDTYYIAYNETDNNPATKFLPINAGNINYFELR